MGVLTKHLLYEDYSLVPNSVLRAKNLSNSDFRLLAYLYSLPNEYKINLSDLATEFGCNESDLDATIQRLEENGHLVIKTKEADAMTYDLYFEERNEEDE